MEVDGGIGGRDFMDEGEGLMVTDDRTRRMEDHSSALAEKLLQGWTLLNEHCPQCLTPLVRNRQKKMYCAACKQWILTESEAAARSLQQSVDKSDVVEQHRNSSPERLTLSNSGAAVAATVSPGHQTNGKSNGISHLRLSLASLRADEEKAQDIRNPKRFAPNDHGQDGVPRSALMNGKETGQSNGMGRGASPAIQRDAVNASPTQAALVLPPIVNPVNDILVARRTLTTLNEKLEGIRQLIATSQDINELRQLFSILDVCIHSIEVTRKLLKSVE